jgi:hypothetical protein
MPNMLKKTYTLTPVQIPGLPRILYFHQNPLETELQEQTKELASLILEMPLKTGIKRSTTYLDKLDYKNTYNTHIHT